MSKSPAMPARLTLDARNDDKPLPKASGLTYHHVIAEENLRGFWDRCVVAHPRELALDFARDLLAAVPTYTLSEASGPAVPHAAKFLSAFVAGEYAHDPAGARPDGFVSFHMLFTWMPGNLFLGPLSQHRANDPTGRKKWASRFDHFAHRFLPAEQYLTIKRAEQALEVFRIAVPEGGYGSGPAAEKQWQQGHHAAHAACRLLAAVARYTTVPPHDPTKWVLQTK